MEEIEKNGWAILVKIYNRRYSLYKKNQGKGLSRKKASNCIIRDIWDNEKERLAYNYLGGYMKKYQDYSIFSKMFFKMINKNRKNSHKKSNPRKGGQKSSNVSIFEKPKTKRIEQKNSGAPVCERPKPYERMSRKERESLGVEIGYENYND